MCIMSIIIYITLYGYYIYIGGPSYNIGWSVCDKDTGWIICPSYESELLYGSVP